MRGSLAALAAFATVASATASAQSAMDKWFAGRYEASCDVVGKQGVQVLTVWGQGKNEAAALKEARRRGVQAILFRGVTGCDVPPMLRPADLTSAASTYLDVFFSDNGRYLGYVEMAGDEVVDAIRLGKDYKIAAIVVINTQRLRRDLENSGILVSLAGSLEGSGASAGASAVSGARTGVAATKPDLMVFPSDQYMSEHGYSRHWMSDGVDKVQHDYARAFREDAMLRSVITNISSAFTDRGYHLKDLEEVLRSLESDAARAQVDERDITVSGLDRLMQVAHPDIRLDLSFNAGPPGLSRSIHFNMSALDAYASRRVADVEGQGEPGSPSQLYRLLKEAVIQRMPVFESQLLDHFRELAAKGREIRVDFVLTGSSGLSFDDEIGGEELGDIVELATKAGAIGRSVHAEPGTRTARSFTGVHIPLVDESGNSYDATAWARDNLARPLRAKYNLDVKRDQLGLGRVRVVLARRAP